jgi:hypothetical protein
VGIAVGCGVIVGWSVTTGAIVEPGVAVGATVGAITCDCGEGAGAPGLHAPSSAISVTMESTVRVVRDPLSIVCCPFVGGSWSFFIRRLATQNLKSKMFVRRPSSVVCRPSFVGGSWSFFIRRLAIQNLKSKIGSSVVLPIRVQS